MTRRPNLLLVVVDSLRAESTGVAGRVDTTPFLEEFAGGAVTYTQARAPSIHTVASHASMFTGHHVEEHGVIDHDARLRPGTTVWEDLSADYATGLFTPNVVLTESSNLRDAFDAVEGPPDSPDYYPGEASMEPYVEAFLEWQEAVDGPWAACLNLLECHYPYNPSDEHDNWGDDDLHALYEETPVAPLSSYPDDGSWWKLDAIKHLYHGAIREADAVLRALLEALDRRGVRSETLTAVTGDHGEGFGERSNVQPDVRLADHRWGIHEVLTHVPLLVEFPGNEFDGSVRVPVSLTDLPRLLERAADGAASPADLVTEGPVLSSTFRVLPSGRLLPAGCPNPKSHLGPWRAVYERDGDTVTKFATRGGRTASATIECGRGDPRVVETDRSPAEAVAARFNGLSDSDVRSGSDRAIGAEVIERLEQLGYR